MCLCLCVARVCTAHDNSCAPRLIRLCTCAWRSVQPKHPPCTLPGWSSASSTEWEPGAEVTECNTWRWRRSELLRGMRRGIPGHTHGAPMPSDERGQERERRTVAAHAASHVPGRGRVRVAAVPARRHVRRLAHRLHGGRQHVRVQVPVTVRGHAVRDIGAAPVRERAVQTRRNVHRKLGRADMELQVQTVVQWQCVRGLRR